jgi:hypothetical protein
MSDPPNQQMERSGPRPGQEVLLKENPAAHLLRDAEIALAHAEQARAAIQSELEASFSRIALLLYFLTLEALINYIYEWAEVEDDSWRSWSIAAKWEKASEKCRPAFGLSVTDSDMPLVPDDFELFSCFLELKSVRNGIAHAKPHFTYLPENQVDAHLDRDERYPFTGLPKRLVAFRVEHAEIAKKVAVCMIKRLDFCLGGYITNLERIPAFIEYVDEASIEYVDADLSEWPECDAG